VIVVDASVALKWFLVEHGSDEALHLAGSGQSLAAPDLIIAEVCNGLWKSARLGRLTSEQVSLAAAKLPDFLSQLAPGRLLAEPAVAIANDLGHPVYDCFYLALAEQLGTKLVTADRRLVAVLSGTSWESRIAGLV
jgi:predicted nucleic acid-binding protein